MEVDAHTVRYATIREDLEQLTQGASTERAVFLFHTPPYETCLDRAATLSREQPVRLTDAIHFAAIERLPGPVRFVTFDPAQIGVALGLGLDVVSA